MRRWVIVGLVVCLGLMPLSAQATERGLAAYPDGCENFFAGAFPPPGVYFQYYFVYYNAWHLKGPVTAVAPYAHGELVGNVFRLVYSSKVQVLGGNWGAHVIVPLMYAGLHLDPIPGASDYQFGVGNIWLTPLILAWHFGDFHVTAALDFSTPGTYSKTKLASPSQNYFTFQPVLGLAWMPKSGFGVNIKMMYDFPTNNTSPIQALGAVNEYHSGQAFHFDYCVDYAVMPNLRIGAAGFYYVQTTGDTVDGVNVGNHARQFAIGPAIKYDYQRWSFMFIPQFEMATMHRPEGARYWAKVWYAF